MQKMICFDFSLVGFFFFARQLLYQIPLLLRGEKKCIFLKSEGSFLEIGYGRPFWDLV